jgi:hypothetical protein
MGQKLIITEEEKNRIKLLYEATPPPSESIFVINKNPFKGTDYENARVSYSSKLTDGDLFFKLICNEETYNKFVTTYNEDKWNPITKSLLNKTYRRSDTIFKIKDITIDSFTDNGKFPQGTITIVNQDNGGTLTQNYKTFWGSFGGGLVYSVPGDYLLPSENPVFDFFRKLYSQSIIGITYEQMNNIRGLVSDETLSKLSNLPDNFFEIRKIQRQKTDF